MLKKEEILEIFLKTEALLEGHFLLTSGRHSDKYVQCAKVLQYPHYTTLLCQEIAARFQGRGISAVIGPAMGGITVAYEAARQLGAKALFSERENGVMTLRRGLNIEAGEKVLVVEDVITTGGSVKEVIQMLLERQAEVVGVGCLVDRSNGQVNLGVPIEALLPLEIQSYEKNECPLCQKGLPVYKPGSRNS